MVSRTRHVHLAQMLCHSCQAPHMGKTLRYWLNHSTYTMLRGRQAPLWTTSPSKTSARGWVQNLPVPRSDGWKERNATSVLWYAGIFAQQRMTPILIQIIQRRQVAWAKSIPTNVMFLQPHPMESSSIFQLVDLCNHLLHRSVACAFRVSDFAFRAQIRFHWCGDVGIRCCLVAKHDWRIFKGTSL